MRSAKQESLKRVTEQRETDERPILLPGKSSQASVKGGVDILWAEWQASQVRETKVTGNSGTKSKEEAAESTHS